MKNETKQEELDSLIVQIYKFPKITHEQFHCFMYYLTKHIMPKDFYDLCMWRDNNIYPISGYLDERVDMMKLTGWIK